MRIASVTPAVGGKPFTRCCISRAAAQATSGLPNTTISSSPIVLTTFPSHFATTARSSPRQASIIFAAGLSPSFSYSAVLPLTSANRIARSLETRVIATDLGSAPPARGAWASAHFGKVSLIFRGLPTAGPSRGESHERQHQGRRAQVLHQRPVRRRRQAVREDQSGGRHRGRAGARGRPGDGGRGGALGEGRAERPLGQDGAAGARRPLAQNRRRHREALRRFRRSRGRRHREAGFAREPPRYPARR